MISKIKFFLKAKTDNLNSAELVSYGRYKRIFLSGGAGVLTKLITLLSGFISIPLTVNYLGPERYGMLMILTSFSLFLSFADFGLGNGLLNKISSAHARSAYKDAQRAISSTLALMIFISFIIGLVYFSTFNYISWDRVFNVESEVAIREAKPAMTVLILFFLINLPMAIVRKVYLGLQKDYSFQVYAAMGSLASLIGVCIGIYYQVGLPAMVFFFMGGHALFAFIKGLKLFLHEHKELSPRLNLVDYKLCKNLLRAGSVFFLLQLFTLIGSSSDLIIITQIIGPEDAGKYSIIQRIFMLAFLTSYFIEPLWPAFGEAMERGDKAWAKQTIVKALQISIVATIVILIPIIILINPILINLIGSSYLPSNLLLLGFFVFSIFANYGGIMSTFLNNKNTLNKQLPIVGITCVFSLALKIYLSGIYGIEGIIWGTIIGYFIFYVYPVYRIAKKELSIN